MGCQLSEYIWHLTSTYYNLPVTYPDVCTDLKGEWTPCSREELKEIDVLGYAFISKPEYNIPKQTPKNFDCNATAVQIVCPKIGLKDVYLNASK